MGPIIKIAWSTFRLINGDFREEVRFYPWCGQWVTRVCDLDGDEISQKNVVSDVGERYFALAINFPNT